MKVKKDGSDQKELLGVAEQTQTQTWARAAFDRAKFYHIPEEFLGELVRDIQNRHGASPILTQQNERLYLDVGGMMSTRTKAIDFEIDGYKFSIKPEHIFYVYDAWMSPKDRMGMKKVYGTRDCFIMSEALHAKVAAKLIGLKPIGDAAYEEMYATLSDAPVIMKSPNKIDGGDEC